MMETRAIRWLGRPVGDITIGWTEEQDARMEEFIRRKMEQGVKFFIVVPFAEEGSITRIPIAQTSQIQGRQVVIGDEDAELLLREGRVGIVGRIMSGLQVIRQTLDPREAARSQTMAVRQPVGG